MAADELVSEGSGVAAFTTFIAPQVGPRPALPLRITVATGRCSAAAPGTGRRYAGPHEPPRSGGTLLRRCPSEPLLTVTGVLTVPNRSLGFAELAPGTAGDLVVYAENHLPPETHVVIPRSSAFADLKTVLYLGRSKQQADLLENSIPLPVSGLQASAVVPFGNTDITIVSTPTGPLAGGLSPQLPWLILLLGVLLSVAAALTTEHLLRRREIAEILAADNARLYGEQRGITETLRTRCCRPISRKSLGSSWPCATSPAPTTWRSAAIGTTSSALRTTTDSSSSSGMCRATVSPPLPPWRVSATPPGLTSRRVTTPNPCSKNSTTSSTSDVTSALPPCCAAWSMSGPLRVALASAGHPPPLLVDESTGPRYVDVPVSTPDWRRRARSPPVHFHHGRARLGPTGIHRRPRRAARATLEFGPRAAPAIDDRLRRPARCHAKPRAYDVRPAGVGQ